MKPPKEKDICDYFRKLHNRDIDRVYKKLSDDEIIELFTLYSQTKDKKIRDKLLINYIPYCLARAGKYKISKDVMQDVIAVGYIAIMDYITAYTPDNLLLPYGLNVQVSFAIHGAMSDYVCENMNTVRKPRNNYKAKIEKWIDKSLQKFNYIDTDYISTQTNIVMDTVISVVYGNVNMVSIDAPQKINDKYDNFCLRDVLEADYDDDVDDKLAKEYLIKKVERLLKFLNDKDVMVIRDIYGFNDDVLLTAKDITKKYNIKDALHHKIKLLKMLRPYVQDDILED